MHFISSPVPEAAGVAHGEQRVCSGEADLLCQLAPGRYFRRLTACRTVPPGKFHSIRYDERTISSA